LLVAEITTYPSRLQTKKFHGDEKKHPWEGEPGETGI